MIVTFTTMCWNLEPAHKNTNIKFYNDFTRALGQPLKYSVVLIRSPTLSNATN